MNFNKQNLSVLRADIDTALKSVELKHGIKFKLGNIRFGLQDFSARLECYGVDTNGDTDINVTEIKALKVLKERGLLYDVDESLAGKVITVQGGQYKFVGINPKAKKFSYIFKNTRNSGYYKFGRSILAQLKA